MTRVLIGFDGSEAARASIVAAAALFPDAETLVATVRTPPPTLEAAALARIALPDAVIREGSERMRAENERQAQEPPPRAPHRSHPPPGWSRHR